MHTILGRGQEISATDYKDLTSYVFLFLKM